MGQDENTQTTEEITNQDNGVQENENNNSLEDQQENIDKASDEDDNSSDANKDDKQGEDTEIYGAPETYDYSETKLPENMVLDEELVKEFEPLAKKFNLSNKSANELMGLAVKLAEKNFAAVGDIAQQIQEQKKTSYIELLNNDAELEVANEAKYNDIINTAIIGVNKFATPGFKQLLKAEGLTHHPEFIKTFHKIGQLCKEDTVPDATFPAGQTEPNAADVLYKDRN